MSIKLIDTESFFYLLRHFGSKKLNSIIILLGLLAFVEALSILTIYPFLYIVINFGEPNISEGRLQYFMYFMRELFGNEYNILLFVGGVSLTIIIAGGLYRLYMAYVVNDYTENIRRSISCFVFGNYFDVNLNFHESGGKLGLVHRSITQPDIFVDQVCKPFFFAAGAIMSCFLILVTLVVISPLISLLLICFVAIYYTLVFLVFRKKVKTYGSVIENANSERISFITDSEKGIKAFLLDLRVPFLTKNYGIISESLGKAKTYYQTLQLTPSYGLETLLFSGLIIGAFVILGFDTQNLNDIQQYGASLGVAAAALYKLKPHAHVIFQAFLALRFGGNSTNELSNITKLFKSNNYQNCTDVYSQRVDIHATGSFGFDEKIILKKIDLNIRANEKVGIIGTSGSGKSTLIDLILGLRQSSSWKTDWSGKDGSKLAISSLRGIASYVPQEPMILNTTIQSNITLSNETELNTVEKERFNLCLYLAGLDEWVDGLVGKASTLLGNGSVQPSGGQKKRIALARALYSNPKILVLDEFTSGLDIRTSKIVIDRVIEYSNRRFGIVFITHDKADLERFDKIYSIHNGYLKLI